MSEIFISYSRDDSQFVDGLIRDLEQKNVDVWVDRQDIVGGTAWRAAISEAISECRAFLIVLSPHSTQSKNVSRELALAESNDRLIIPIIYQDCKIPPSMQYQLSELQLIDFNKLGYATALDRLLRALAVPAGGTSAEQAQRLEQRRSNTARLRQILESGVAPAPANATVAPPPPAPRVQKEPPAPQPPVAGSAGKGFKSTPALVGAACALLLGIGGFAFYHGPSSAGAQASQQPAGPTAGAATYSPSPTSPPQPANTKPEQPRAKSPLQPATTTQTVPPVAPASATPKPAAPDNPANVVIGNKRFHTYFLPNCAAREGVNDQTRVEFKTEDEAKAIGYNPDVRCRPLDEAVRIRGNKTTKDYFIPRCQSGWKKISEDELVEFKNQAEAIAAGYKIAPACH